ncbi:hypothetical protein HYX17_05425 [Candidatus Woesearchaeota archaeon]|nr:hypothetical protein [Candidatus Woesearchaeota archaeon]
MIIKEYDLRISKIIQETHDTKTFRINFNDEFSFEPGQFINLTLDILQNGEVKQLTRQYSISSSPTKKNYIDLTIKKMANGIMSNYIVDNSTIGDKIKIKGPYGMFTFKDDVKKAVFIAGGSGISSLISMIRYIADKNLDVDVTLLFSNKTPKDIIFRSELDELKEKKFNIINTVTRYNGDEWDGEIGRINKEMIRKYCDLDSLFYICGLPEMVDSVRKELETLGIEKARVKFEKY